MCYFFFDTHLDSLRKLIAYGKQQCLTHLNSLQKLQMKQPIFDISGIKGEFFIYNLFLHDNQFFHSIHFQNQFSLPIPTSYT